MLRIKEIFGLYIGSSVMDTHVWEVFTQLQSRIFVHFHRPWTI